MKESKPPDNYSSEIRKAVVADFFKNEGQHMSSALEYNIGIAGIYRILNQEVAEGRLSPDMRKPANLRRMRILNCIKQHLEETNERIANLAEVSVATVYRAKQQITTLHESEPIEVPNWPTSGVIVEHLAFAEATAGEVSDLVEICD